MLVFCQIVYLIKTNIG